MDLDRLLTADTAPTADEINAAIFGTLSRLAAKFEKRDDANPWANSPSQCLKRMTLQMAEAAHGDDDISHLIKWFRIGTASLTRAAYDLDVGDDLDRAADEIAALAESICDELRREATRLAA